MSADMDMGESQGQAEPTPGLQALRLQAAALSLTSMSHDALVHVLQGGLNAADLARLECTSRAITRRATDESARLVSAEHVKRAQHKHLDLDRMLALWGPRWSRVLHRIEVVAGKTNPLRFTKAGPGIITSIERGGSGAKAAGMPVDAEEWGAELDPDQGGVGPYLCGYDNDKAFCPVIAICADHVMNTGVHSAEFTVDPHTSDYMGIGVVRADWNPNEGGHASETDHGWALLGAISGVDGDDSGLLRHGSGPIWPSNWGGLHIDATDMHPCAFVNGKQTHNMPISSRFHSPLSPTLTHPRIDVPT